MRGFELTFVLFGVLCVVFGISPISAAPKNSPANCSMDQSAECRNCSGPWSYMFDVRGWQVALENYIRDKEDAKRFKAFANNDQTSKAAVKAGVELWLHYQDAEFQSFVRNFSEAIAEEVELFHEDFLSSNGTSAEAKEAFQKILDIEKDESLSISQECGEISKVLSANVKACRELRNLQPYDKLVRRQKNVEPLPRNYVLGRLDEEERNALAKIFNNFTQPKSKTKLEYFAWVARQTPAVRAMSYALLDGRKLENKVLLEKAKSQLSQKNYKILEEIVAIYYDDKLSVRQECEKIGEKRAKLDARALKLDAVSAFADVGENCDKHHRQHFFSMGLNIDFMSYRLIHMELG